MVEGAVILMLVGYVALSGSRSFEAAGSDSRSFAVAWGIMSADCPSRGSCHGT